MTCSSEEKPGVAMHRVCGSRGAAAPMTTAYLGMGISVIVEAFVVVVIGGLGSIVGSMAGSLIVGAAQTWGAFYLPEAAMVIMYAVMGAILVFRPWGLFGEEE